MFGKAKKQQEVEYTCKRCARQWYRPFVNGARIVKPSDGALKGARMQATASRMSLGGSRRRAGAELQLANMQAEYDRQMKAYNSIVSPTCPDCGSKSVSNKIVDV